MRSKGQRIEFRTPTNFELSFSKRLLGKERACFEKKKIKKKKIKNKIVLD